jgi:hypothetical protein
VTACPTNDSHATAQVQAGPLTGLSGSIIATTPQGQTYLQLNNLPGVTVVLPSRLLQALGPR